MALRCFPGVRALQAIGAHVPPHGRFRRMPAHRRHDPARRAYDRHDRSLMTRITARQCSRRIAVLSSRLDGDLRARDQAVSPPA
ncbi:hypothetical protein BLAT2472_10151 [Burkholderia latens]